MTTSGSSFVQRYRIALLTLLALVLLPFVIGLFEGASPFEVWSNQSGMSRFIQGLAIEIFILALYALSYDLIFGFTGLLSFGHSMFFAVGAYLTGIALKSFGLNLGQTFGVLMLAAVVQALLFGIVLPRVKGITFCTGPRWVLSERVSILWVMSRETGRLHRCRRGVCRGPSSLIFISPAYRASPSVFL
jgi:hypothetical protein